jgi:hypothetical protein
VLRSEKEWPPTLRGVWWLGRGPKSPLAPADGQQAAHGALSAVARRLHLTQQPRSGFTRPGPPAAPSLTFPVGEISTALRVYNAWQPSKASPECWTVSQPPQPASGAPQQPWTPPPRRHSQRPPAVGRNSPDAGAKSRKWSGRTNPRRGKEPWFKPITVGKQARSGKPLRPDYHRWIAPALRGALIAAYGRSSSSTARCRLMGSSLPRSMVLRNSISARVEAERCRAHAHVRSWREETVTAAWLRFALSRSGRWKAPASS